MNASSTCVLKTCMCIGGTSATGTDCPNHAATKCASCDAGYYMGFFYPAHVGECGGGSEKNMGTKSLQECADACNATGVVWGTDAKGFISKVNISNPDYPSGCWCETARSEVQLPPSWLYNECRKETDTWIRYDYEDVCWQNQCTCIGGTGAANTDCPSDGGVKCVSCGAGYYKNGTECTACEAGKHQTDNWFTGNSCAQNVCLCSNGTGTKGTNCTSNGADKCASCNAGYRLDRTYEKKTSGECEYITNETECTKALKELGETSLTINNLENPINFNSWSTHPGCLLSTFNGVTSVFFNDKSESTAAVGSSGYTSVCHNNIECSLNTCTCSSNG